MDNFIRFDAFESDHFRRHIIAFVLEAGYDLNVTFPQEHPTEYLATKLFGRRNFTHFHFASENRMRNRELWRMVRRLEHEEGVVMADLLSAYRNDSELTEYLRGDASSQSFISSLRNSTMQRFWDAAHTGMYFCHRPPCVRSLSATYRQ